MTLLEHLHRVAQRGHLSAEQARAAMEELLAGRASDAQTGAFLVALRMKGETAEELAGFARAMREHMIAVEAGEVVDNCGTGGDSSGTFNVSTVAAFAAAGAGARVAKHGNRSISSATGGADVLEALGVRIALSPEEAARVIRETGFVFLFAPVFHPAMKHVQAVRRELKMRTVFNLLGPLVNPARAQAQVIGAPSLEAASLIAEALHQLGTRRAFVVHGRDGLDEVTLTAETDVFEVTPGGVARAVWTPEDFGVARASPAALQGGDAQRNAAIALAILEGERGPRRDMVLVNASAALVAAGLAADLRAGVELAARSVDSGAARAKLEAVRRAVPAATA
jgi:anthranilate phosphoribosyltransferase